MSLSYASFSPSFKLHLFCSNNSFSLFSHKNTKSNLIKTPLQRRHSNQENQLHIFSSKSNQNLNSMASSKLISSFKSRSSDLSRRPKIKTQPLISAAANTVARSGQKSSPARIFATARRRSPFDNFFSGADAVDETDVKDFSLASRPPENNTDRKERKKKKRRERRRKRTKKMEQKKQEREKII